MICNPPVQVRGAQKVGTAQSILPCPILFPSAAGIDPCWFWHSCVKTTRGQRLLLLGAAARGMDVLLCTCLLLGHHAVTPVGFQSWLQWDFRAAWDASVARLGVTTLSRECFLLSYSGRGEKAWVRSRFAQEEAKYWVNVTLCGQVQLTNSELTATDIVPCSLLPSLLGILYAADLSCVFVLGLCFVFPKPCLCSVLAFNAIVTLQAAHHWN